MLNIESHMEERTRGGSVIEFMEMLNMYEKQRTARVIVSFISIESHTCHGASSGTSRCKINY